MSLPRRTELKRTGFKQNPEKPWKQLKRGKRLKPMSDKRRDELPERDRMAAEVLKRDGGKCQLSYAFPDLPCGGELHPHHLLKASQGGKYVAENLLTACNRHNDEVENEPELAEAMGLVHRPEPQREEPWQPVLDLAPENRCSQCGDEIWEIVPGVLAHKGDLPHAHRAVPATA